MTDEASTAAKLEELLAAIRAYPDPRRASGEWKQVYKLLGTLDIPAGRVNGIVGMRDVAGLADAVAQLRQPADAQPADEGEAADIDAETCRRALKAFRKRQRLTKLDDESKLGRGPLSKGSNEAFAAIEPPNEWPEAVWQELVRQGKLKYLGHGFYELAKQPPQN